MEEIRKILGCSLNVHCMFRSQKYNQEVVKAIPNDVHAQNLACDFDASPKYTIDQVHAILEPLLEQLGIRMERTLRHGFILTCIQLFIKDTLQPKAFRNSRNNPEIQVCKMF